MILEEKSYRLSPASKLLLVLQSLNAVEAISRLDQALREARAEGMAYVAGTGCMGKDRVCCYECWQIQKAIVSGEEAAR